ncbi:tRNA (guanine-N(7)-)-methyltransferase non-catalytic subunit trm82 [Ophidiomyces ophidiicola]|nr:tRNA (guanine-N(7)-)-methyltransferase non-catalytic subunit trm82 [Ophidiomyces ophidiicola]KAI2055233.1 tRNA (guanine-N(7)-)-methyltransferase non-catalytic subunit trm82 [Ophidiomyces ophidiicola]KAI2067235.1 tRNA (guanine-N(7)-)-methyltransferase non-catalytic subunit trm82 [Ophidiomyces ophidiicola]KAI2077393.1 tRNA (guanine-N(7)-)-methyltransferase non-catalytic subunit trm82 [Ophidiomyces ophidiicola]KAI2093508.1 tRNA (guanine-N(7)-)-methyltransferase non-catalytic subunit trm82 [Ophi
MTFRYPIQRIRHFKCQQRAFFAATAGPTIVIIDSGTGIQLSAWPDSTLSAKESGDAIDTCKEPPEKRRKLSTQSNDEADKPTENKPAGLGATKIPWSTIPILVISSTGDHIVAVTGEDKCLRVFTVTRDGALAQISERYMPKRPCAVTLTPDNSTILSGDKFGDVYSLPLIPKSEVVVLPSRKSAEPQKTFQPSATNLTVHTQRNLKALEQQLRNPHVVQDRSEPTFEYKLLLGHVSMLTDMTLVSIPATASSSARSYLITSDRDEHIRVSRGPSQSHIIHNYCLGHTSFVSKLCVPSWHPNVLISGGGDNFIICWDWHKGRISQKLLLGGSSNIENEETENQTPNKYDIIVSGIWAIPFSEVENAKGAILVALEGVPKLLPFSLDLNGTLLALAPLELSGNPLDVISLENSGKILVSLDNIHKPGSTNELRDSTQESPLLQYFTPCSNGEISWTNSSIPAVDVINAREATDTDADLGSQKAEAMSSLLYTNGSLRKWSGGDDA